MHKAYAEHGMLPENLLEFIRKGEEVLIFDGSTLIARLLPAKSDKPESLPVYHDLDDLAGTWSAKDELDFLAATADFCKIDETVWQ